MSIPRRGLTAPENALVFAHGLVDMGVPVFRGRLTEDGNPDRLDARWKSWQETRPSHLAVDKWRNGEALCAVTGIALDVLDVDPRNGGELSFKRLARELGEDGPEVYARVRTPSGGEHLYIASLGIGKHSGFLRGLDLQGGRPEGTGRGFVFLPPTIRPSKMTGERNQYSLIGEPEKISGFPCELLKEYIGSDLGKMPGMSKGRNPLADLRQACISAEAGGQREALLRYVHELERQGTPKNDTLHILQDLCGEMPVYDKRRPWYPAKGRPSPNYWLNTLFHKPGTVVPDATEEEMEDLEGISPQSQESGIVQWVSDIPEETLAWLWYGRIALGEMTLLDGEKGKGKSFITYDIIARATRGLPMPGEDRAETGPMTVMLFTDEGGWGTTIRPRLRAAGADIERVARVSPSAVRSNWGLPKGATKIGRAIRESGASLAVFDPVTDMIGEEIQSHNDASVRRALAPLASELSTNGCAGLAIRHFNKAVGVGARNRGSGSSAFQNRARVHMITGELPPGSQDKFGIAIVDTNLTSKDGIDGVVGYTIVNSEIATGDRQGTYHGKVSWGSVAQGITADILADGYRKPGPSAVRKQEVIELLADMFQEKDTWPQKQVMEMLKEAGASTTNDIVREAREALGIRTTPERQKGKAGVQGWLWTTVKIRGREDE